MKGWVVVVGVGWAVTAWGQGRDVVTRLREAQAQIEAGSSEQAVVDLEALVEERPTLADAHRLLGHALQRSGRPARARAAFLECVAHGRATSDVYAALLRLDQEAGHAAAAAMSLEWLVWYHPTHTGYALLRAEASLREGALEAAAREVEAVLARRPSSLPGLRLLGRVRLEQDDVSGALQAWSAAYWIGPEDGALARAIAELHQRAGSADQAVEWHQRAFAGGDDDRAWAVRVAELALAAGRAEEALEWLEGRGESARVEELRGHAAMASGREEAARAAWGRAVVAGSRDPAVLEFVAAEALVGAALGSAELVGALEGLEALGDPPPARVELLVRGWMRVERPVRARAVVRGYVESHGLDARARGWVAVLAGD